MKRFYLIICFLMSIIGSAWGQETYSVTAESTITPGAEFQATTYVKLTYGVEGSSWEIKTATPANGANFGTIWATAGSGAKLENNIPISGTFVKIVPSANGVMKYNVFINTANDNPKVANAINAATGETIAQFTGGTKEKIAGDLEFNVEKNEEYYIYTSGSSALCLGGFTFTPSAGDDTDHPVETSVSTFNISDFNYVTNKNANSGLDRSLFGFNFVFSGGDALKYNGGGKLTFRTRNTTQNGSVAISTANGAKIFSASFTFDKNMTGYYTATDGDGDLTSSVSDNVVTVTSAQGVSKIVFTKVNVTATERDDNTEFQLSAISLTTDTEMSTEMVTPELTSFKSSAITVDLDGGKVDNPLTTNPPSFAVTYSSSNTDVATVDTNTGAVTLRAAGETTITAEYGGGTYYNAAASTSYTLTVTATPCLEISSTEQTLNADYVYKTNACSTKTDDGNGGTQIIDAARDGAYIIFDVKPTENGTYVFTAPIATPLDGMSVQLGYINENGEYVVSSTTAEIAKAGWYLSNATNYEWKFYLEADTRYTFKMSCLVTNDYKTENYRVNVFDMTIKKADYLNNIWTIKEVDNGKKLTINEDQSGLLASGSSATLEGFAKVTFAGQDWTVTSDNNHLKGGKVVGRKTSAVSNGVPNGEYIIIEPITDGILTLDACHWTGRRTTAIIKDGDASPIITNNPSNNIYGDVTYQALLKKGEKYHVYINARNGDVDASYNFEVEAITFTTAQQETLNYNVADFNYYAGTSVNNGANKTGLDRKNVCGLDFTIVGDANSPKFNNTDNGLNVSSQSSILTIGIAEGSDKLANSENKIVSVEFTKPNGNPSDGSLDANVDGEWSNGVFTTTTPAAKIAFTGDGSDFKIGNMKVTTLYEKNYSTITPVLTFEKEAVEAVVGATLTNPLTVKNGDAVIENFRVAYTVSDATIATIEEEHGTATITPLQAGTVTVTATFDGKRWGDANQDNKIYSAASKTFTLTVIDETVSFANSEVVFAVNTSKAYTAATGDDGKVTYTELEGKVNAATSTAGNAMTYTSSDENLIKVNAETGELSLGDNWTAGKAVIITATSAAGQTATYTVKLKFETSIEFGVESVNAHLNVGFVEPKATIVPAGVNLVTYSSNNPKIATVNESTGEVTFPASSTGTVAITATIPDNDYYMGSTDKYEIKVGSAISAGDAALTNYEIVSYQDSKYTANTGHKFTVENATADKKIISGEQFTNVPGIELTFGAYTGLGNVNNGDLANLGTTWTLGEDKYLAHETAATYDEETNLPIGGYMAFEPVVSGILTMDLTWYKGQTFVLVDKSTNAIVESYTAGSEYAGEHRFSTPLQAGRTYYLYNKGGKVDGVEVNDVMKFRSASFTPVFLDKVTSIIPSKLTDGKVLFNIMGADYYNGSSVIPSLSTARHDHDDITYKLSDGTYLNMTADGVFEILEAMEGNNNAVTVTITANIEAKTAAPNDDTDGDTDHMHSSVAVCQVTYTKSDIKFAKESIDVTLFAENKGADIVEPALTYTKDDVAYASSNTNAFTVDANTGNLTVGTNPSGETTITATVNNDDILRYYTNNSAQYKINCKNYSHVKINQTEVEMTVGETGVNILRRGFIEVVHEHLGKLYRQNENGTLYGDEGKRPVYQTAVVEQFVNGTTENDVNKFFADATKTIIGKNNGSANTNILYVNKVLTMDAKAAGTTTVYVNLEKLAYSENGQEENPTITTPFDAVTIPIKVTIKPREFTAENATLRVWDFTKEIDAATLQTFANSNSTYWTYNESDNTVKTSVIKPEEGDGAAYYEKYEGDKAAFLEGKKAFENQVFDLSVFNETLKQEGSKDVLRLSTLNNSNYEKYLGLDEEQKEMHKHTLNVVSDITLNKKSTIKDNNYMPPVDGSNTNFGENSDECYRGINLEGKASFLHVPNVGDNISIMMVADHNSDKTDDFLDFASSGSNQAGLIVGPSKMTDGTYAAGYNYNRLTTVVNYAPRTDENGIVTEVAVEPAGGQVNVVSVVAGYIATSGILNKGEGKVPTSADTRTDGYTTVVSPYNIDMTGQKVVKAYICDYYGKDNNKVHMKQIKHIPANTPVMLRGYARDLYALFISEGNKAVDPGVDESFIKNNRLRGNATEDMYVPLEETEVNSEGEVVKYYNYGLSGSKWVKFGTDGTMKAGKAYLRLTEKEWADLQEAMISSAGVSATRLSFEFEDLDVSDDNVSTGIVQVGIQKDVAGDGYYYSINGIRIGKEKPASKGVYIYNGKKIVVR